MPRRAAASLKEIRIRDAATVRRVALSARRHGDTSLARAVTRMLNELDVRLRLEAAHRRHPPAQEPSPRSP